MASDRADNDGGRIHVVIVGLMGVGKSTTAAALADRLDREHLDSDTDIERLLGRTGRDFAATNGVAKLHDLEAAVLIGALARTTPAVISAGASTVEREVVRLVLGARATVVRLVLDLDEIIDRQAEGGHRRPMDRDELAALAARREPFFAEVEDLRLSADRPPAELAEIIAHSL